MSIIKVGAILQSFAVDASLAIESLFAFSTAARRTRSIPQRRAIKFAAAVGMSCCVVGYCTACQKLFMAPCGQLGQLFWLAWLRVCVCSRSPIIIAN
jgi:hypothetical protein